MLHEVGLKGRFIQIDVEIVDKRLERWIVRIMTDLITRLLPDMFLRVQLRASGREVQQFQARVLVQDLVQRRAMMPGGQPNNNQMG